MEVLIFSLILVFIIVFALFFKSFGNNEKEKLDVSTLSEESIMEKMKFLKEKLDSYQNLTEEESARWLKMLMSKDPRDIKIMHKKSQEQ
ncbi:MAG: hypothetical protein B7Y68_03405, partial [Thiotrichales bacterium 35-46-9]